MRGLRQVVLAGLCALVLASCSKSNPNAVPLDPVTGKHPAGWVDQSTGGTHPRSYLAGPSACLQCHGKNLAGGISGVSCFSASRSGFTCHPGGPSGHTAGWSAPSVHGASAKALAAGRDGIEHCEICHGSTFAGGIGPSCLDSAGCHGVGVLAPHPARPWLSTIGGRTHSTTHPSNAAGCALCHAGGANSTRTPSTPAAAGTAPGCFNNTLCHGVEGHASGWAAPSAHGVAAKQPVAGGTGFDDCTYCHGNGFDGGIAQQSCLSTSGCHGVAAPHPAKPWRSTIGGVTHTTTDTSNAPRCATCHAGGANSTVTPQPGNRTGLTGCFDNTMCHGAIGHPAGWNLPAQHGAQAKLAPASDAGFSSCQPCHGAFFVNGAAPSCLNSAACHGPGIASPHPRAPWTSASGGSTHTDTDAGNAGTCAICHTAGANSTVKPPSPATGTLAGCFNNTLCHFHQIPFKPSATIPASLHGNEAKKDLTVCQACHGTPGTVAFDGVLLADGTRTIACSSCHSAAKAHPTDWQGSGSYSHRTAGNRGGACTLCHDVTQGRTAPLPAAPSCFSATFSNALGQARTCHASGPGVAPHGVPYNNHNATARSNFTYCLGCHQIATDVVSGTTTIPRCLTCHLTSPQTNPVNCVSCHSNPPSGTGYPNTAGSHATHLSINAADICGACHSGLGLGTVDHLNRARARTASVQAGPAVFGVLAKTGGLSPSFNPATGACANTYCHGASLPGGSNTTPIWGQTGYLQGCGTCHGFPPAVAAHASVTSSTPCAGCHSHVNSTNTGFTDPTLHINGVIDVAATAPPHPVPNYRHQAAGTGAACTACHSIGTASSVYPVVPLGNPPDCRGCHAKAAPGIGCGSCHGGADGRPTGTVFPDIANRHSLGAHQVACSFCHGTAGTNQDAHGPSNRTAHSDANVVITMTSDAAGMVFTRSGNGSGTCTGTCHGEGHSNRRW